MKTAIALLLSCLAAHAQFTTLITSITGGNEVQAGPGTAGFPFTTGSAPETVRALGVYDSSPLDPGLFNSHHVGLWDNATHALLAFATVPAQGATAIGAFEWVNVDVPVTLAAGHTYVLGLSLVDNDFDFTIANASAIGVAPNNAIGHALLSTGTGFGFPDLTVSGADLGFVGPNLSFAPVPEPSTYAMWTGLFLLAFTVLRRARCAILALLTCSIALSADPIATLAAIPRAELPAVAAAMAHANPALRPNIVHYLARQRPAVLPVLKVLDNRPPVTPGNENGQRPVIPPGLKNYATP